MLKFICLIVLASLMLLNGCASQPDSDVSAINHFRAGETAYKRGDLQTARKNFEALLKKAPDNVEAWFRLGNIAMMEHDLEQAEKHYATVIQLKPRYAKAHYNLALVHLTQAESYFQNYTATVTVDDENERLMRLMAEIDVFSNNKTELKSNPLDSLAELLSRTQ